jgi:choline transport protein
MFLSVAINSVFAFAFTLCLLYCLGNYQAVSTSPTGLPIIEVYYEATKSVKATNFFVAMIFIMYMIGNFNIIASVSRLTWAFARDNGLPFSKFFSYVSTSYAV